MICSFYQRRLLSTEQPESPALDIETHLAGCQACREFQRQLLLLESNVPRIPVLASTGKERLLQMLLQPAAPVARPAPIAAVAARLPVPVSLPAQAPAQVRRAAWRSHWGTHAAAAAMAACVLIACGIWLGKWLVHNLAGDGKGSVEQAQQGPDNKAPEIKAPENKKPAPTNNKINDPFAKKDKKAPAVKNPALTAKLMEYDLKLAAPQSARERVEVLAAMAKALHEETKVLVESTASPKVKREGLEKLAGLYKQVVHEGVIARARDLPMGERREVLEAVAEQMVEAETDAKKQAKQLAKQLPGVAAAFQVIEVASHAGDVQLRKLMEEAE
jgi:hypothetical protein